MSKKQEHKWSLVAGIIFAVANFLLVGSRLGYSCFQGISNLCEDAFSINFPTTSIVFFLTSFFVGGIPPKPSLDYFVIFTSGIIQYFALGVLFGFVAYKIFNYAKSKRIKNQA